MIGVDTNFMLRVLLRDDIAQSAVAERRLAELARDGEEAFVSSVVLAEIAWVLRRLVRADREAIASTVASLLRARTLHLENEHAVERALDDFRNGRCDFADALIGRLAEQAGCTTSWTFDQKASALPTFTAVPV